MCRKYIIRLVTLGFHLFRSPVNFGMDDMDLAGESMNNVDISIMENIDVRQILGLTQDDFPNQAGNF